MTPHRCPVCGGNGQVMNGFYGQVGGEWTSGSTAFEQCRSCNGTGVVWQPSVMGAFMLDPTKHPLMTALGGPMPIPCTCPQEVKDGKPWKSVV